MKIGIMGLGKVGLPIALSLAVHGKHEVTGYDLRQAAVREILEGRMGHGREEGMPELLAMDHGIVLAGNPAELAKNSGLVIIAVPTPHPPGFGGEVPVTEPARDFDYGYLVNAVTAVCRAAAEQEKRITVMVLSTVLPGTMRRLILPLGNDFTTIVYSPAFISLGTTIPDFEYPPFVLCGTDDPEDAEPVREMYSTLPAAYGAYFSVTGIETAEIAKMMYNAYGALRITFANMIAELCGRFGGDCDRVTDLLHFAPSAVRGGMPDGGPCRPRDLIALSWLADAAGLSYDFFGDIAKAREAHARWLAEVTRFWAVKRSLPVVVLGVAYKPGTDLTDGSPSLLLKHYLGDCEIREPGVRVPPVPAVYLVAVNYLDWKMTRFAPGSVVIDPWGDIDDQENVRVLRVGRN